MTAGGSGPDRGPRPIATWRLSVPNLPITVLFKGFGVSSLGSYIRLFMDSTGMYGVLGCRVEDLKFRVSVFGAYGILGT